jgi:uncharacterized protein DUF664
MDDRPEPPLLGDERATLRAFLDYQRATFAWKVGGLSSDQLRERSVPPSAMSPLGLVRHLGDVERSWFRRVLEGATDAPPRWYSEDNIDGDWDDVDDADVDAAFTYWEEECAHAREVEASFASLGDSAYHPRWERDVSVRWVLVHMIEEYARHNGHADLIRERIDGGAIGE